MFKSTAAKPRVWISTSRHAVYPPTTGGARSLASASAYAIATGLIFALFFIVPYVVLRAL